MYKYKQEYIYIWIIDYFWIPDSQPPEPSFPSNRRCIRATRQVARRARRMAPAARGRRSTARGLWLREKWGPEAMGRLADVDTTVYNTKYK